MTERQRKRETERQVIKEKSDRETKRHKREQRDRKTVRENWAHRSRRETESQFEGDRNI